ncbi:hypothetical protein VQ056_05945 [Paenibacillus sp. JTLBN-2024]
MPFTVPDGTLTQNVAQTVVFKKNGTWPFLVQDGLRGELRLVSFLLEEIK